MSLFLQLHLLFLKFPMSRLSRYYLMYLNFLIPLKHHYFLTLHLFPKSRLCLSYPMCQKLRYCPMYRWYLTSQKFLMTPMSPSRPTHQLFQSYQRFLMSLSFHSFRLYHCFQNYPMYHWYQLFLTTPKSLTPLMSRLSLKFR
jgi:hypothetical protein